MTPLLVAEHLDLAYGEAVACHDLSFEIADGEIVALIGANGAGKSTTLRAVAGILPPRRGSIRFRGTDLGRLPSHSRANLGIALVPEGRHVFPFLTVRENLMMGSYTRRDKDAVHHDLELCFSYFPVLQERSHQRAGLLSGGEQQMLSISRALMGRPKLLLLDEPSLGLSPILVSQIFRIIRRINDEQGVAILLVEQNAHMALRTAQFGYVLEVGRIVLADDCAKLMQSDAIKEFYLGQKDAGIRGQRRWKRKRLWH
jgi:branched-chain amino acid transport system ATP-binding protein